MKLLSRARAAWARYLAWRKANSLKALRQMPIAYLMLVAAPSAFGIALVKPNLDQASSIFFEQLLPIAPWHISAVVGVLLLSWWAMVGIMALLAATHAKALGDRLFEPASK